MSRAFLAAVLMAFVLGVSGCGQRPRPPAEERPVKVEDDGKVEADAWLFDAKLRMEGKPRSFRLEVYHTDSVAALAGRAYLGRGALRGRLTVDSLLVYFPSRDEYVDESTTALLSASECLRSAGQINLLKLFNSTPDEVLEGETFGIDTRVTGNRKRCLVSADGCPWQIELVYDSVDDAWLLREFEVDNGDDIRLTGKRRTHKKRAKIDRSRFQVPIPASAALIRP